MSESTNEGVTIENPGANQTSLSVGDVVKKVISLNGVLTMDDAIGRREFWLTYAILGVPLFLIGGIAYGIGYVSDTVMMHKICVSIASLSFSVVSLGMFPTIIRRLRDVGLSVYLSIACFAIALVPYVGFVSYVAFAVIGFLPRKKEFEGELSLKTKMCLWMIAVAIVIVNVSCMAVSYTWAINDRMDQELREATRGY